MAAAAFHGKGKTPLGRRRRDRHMAILQAGEGVWGLDVHWLKVLGTMCISILLLRLLACLSVMYNCDGSELKDAAVFVRE